MWDVLFRTPRGSIHPWKLSLLFATVVMASFGYLLAVAPSAHAAPDATWDNQSIRYNDHTYERVEDTEGFPSQVADSPAIYQYIDTSANPNRAHFIYFSGDNPQSEKQATYVRYSLAPPSTYTEKAGQKTLSITPVPEEDQPDTEDANVFQGEFTGTCTIDGIGWLVCPIMTGISEGMDYIFEKIRAFLVVQPMTTEVDSPIYRMWQISRDLANVAFVVGFLVIIYNYIVGGGMSGYQIRKIIPRLVVAAILINISYVICAVAVDISNIMGYGVNQLFEQVRDTTMPGSSAGDGVPVNWSSVSAWVIAGGGGVVAAGMLIPGSVGGVAGLWFLLAPFLLGAALVVMVTFLILAARQAIIVIAVVIAPLAFAAYILPNTEKWFEKWRSLFFTMLVMFPAFAAVFGGAQLAGEIIIRSSNSIEQVILGLGVMVAPLAITPLLLKLGGGLLGRIGGIINNKEKGISDRFRNFSGERRQDLIAKRQARYANARRNDDFSGFRKGTKAWSRRAATNYARGNYRKEQRKLNEEAAQNDWHSQTGRWGYSSDLGDPTAGKQLSRYNQNGRGSLDTYKRDNQLIHDKDQAHHDEHWQKKLDADPIRREMLTDTRLTTGRSDVIQKAHEAQDELTLQAALNGGEGIYAPLKDMKIQTAVTTGVADIHKAAIESAGKLALGTTVAADDTLREMKIKTYATEQKAEVIQNTLQKDAEAGWLTVSRTDEAVQQLRLKEVQASDGAKRAEEQWNTLVENVAAKGAEAPEIATANASIADSVMGLRQDIRIEAKAQESARGQQDINLMTALKESQEAMIDPTKGGDPTLLKRAAGIGGQKAEARIFAQATKSVVDAAVTEVQDNRYLLSQYTRDQLHKVLFKGKGLQGEGVTTEMRQAAMYELLQKKGNNDDAQVIRNAVADMGMLVDEQSGKFYEPKRDSEGRIIPGPNGQPQPDMSREIQDKDVGARRDWQQFFADAAKGSPHSMVTLSGTDKSNAESGTLTSGIRDGFMRDALGGKFGPDKMLKADIDELKYLYSDMVDPNGEYNKLGSEQKAQVNRAIVESIISLQKHPTYKGQIDDRNRGLMNQIVAAADERYATSLSQNGKPVFFVDEDNSLMVPPTNPTGNEKTFAAPVKGKMDFREGNDWRIT